MKKTCAQTYTIWMYLLYTMYIHIVVVELAAMALHIVTIDNDLNYEASTSSLVVKSLKFTVMIC